MKIVLHRRVVFGLCFKLTVFDKCVNQLNACAWYINTIRNTQVVFRSNSLNIYTDGRACNAFSSISSFVYYKNQSLVEFIMSIQRAVFIDFLTSRDVFFFLSETSVKYWSDFFYRYLLLGQLSTWGFHLVWLDFITEKKPKFDILCKQWCYRTVCRC